jgi:DNA polymerase
MLGNGDWQWGPVWFRKECIELPNGMFLYYHNLRQEAGGKFGTEWVFDYGGKKKRIYGGKLLENIVQALARIITMEAAVRVRLRLAKLGIHLALQVHDELVFVVRKEHEAITRKVLEHELKQRPKWLPNLPLDCEVGAGPDYASAK